MKFKQLMALALIGFAVGACKRPDGGEDSANVDPEGKTVKGKIAITLPKTIRTYAPGDTDPNATAEEINATTMDVFIYNDGGSYTLAYTNRLTYSATGPLGNQFAPSTAGTEFETAEFTITEGDKLVYIGINLPDLIANRLRTGYYVNEIYENPDLFSKLLNNGGAGNVAFFNAGIVGHDFKAIADGGDGPTVTIPVSRLVAKVAVMTPTGSDTWEVNGGTVKDFEFAIGQRNNQMFVLPRTDYTDPNYDINAADGNLGDGSTAKLANDFAAYSATGDKSSFVDFKTTDPNVLYLTENMSAAHQHKDLTYVSIRAMFVPHRWGADPEAGGAVNTIEGDFWAVFTGDAVGDDGLGVRYFDDVDDARAFVASPEFAAMTGQTVTPYAGTPGDPINESAVLGEADFYIHFYDDGYCYYRIYLNPDGEGPGTDMVEAYDIIRNSAYLATITGVNYIGTTAPEILPGSKNANDKGTPTYPGDWFPNNYLPAAVQASDVVEPEPTVSSLSVSVTLDPWELEEGNYQTY